MSGDKNEDSPVDNYHFSVKSAADYSNATLADDANGNILLGNDICQADTAINNEDHSYAASTVKCAKYDNFREDHSYNLESPRTLKRKNQATEQILQKYRKRLRRRCQKSRRLKRKVCTLKGVTKELRKKLLISNRCTSLLESINEVPKHILWKIQEGKKSAKYSEDLKQFATTLYSPKAYEYVRDNFQKALPHSHTIRSWYSSISADPGFRPGSRTKSLRVLLKIVRVLKC